MRVRVSVGGLVCLWAVMECTAAVPGPVPAVDSPRADLDQTVGLLWGVVERAVRATVAPMVAQLGTRLGDVEAELDSLGHKLDRLTSEIGSVKSEIGGVKTDVNSVQTDVGRVKAEIDSGTSKLDRLQTTANSILSEIGNFTPGVVISGLEVSSVQSGIVGIVSQLVSLRSALLPEVTGLSRRRLAELESNGTTEPCPDTSGGPTAAPPTPPSRRQGPLARDCSDLPDSTPSGIHQLQLSGHRTVRVYCDMETDGGGWTVIQRRADVQPRQNFSLDWQAYKQGFGKLESEFWWGLESLHQLTARSDRRYQLRIGLRDFDGGQRHALYQTFSVGPETEGYKLLVSGYSGNAGDSFSGNSGAMFSTEDRDPSRFFSDRCGIRYRGGGWFDSCGSPRLNAPYQNPPTGKRWTGIFWRTWRGTTYSMKNIEMKIKPAS